MQPTTTHDVLIVGGGPIGIACGIEATKRGISSIIVEKGCLLNSLQCFPPAVVFFSSPHLLELGDIPMVVAREKPSRAELLFYYRRVAEHFELELRLYDKVESIAREPGNLFRITTGGGQEHRARFVVLAIGCYDFPNLLNVPGEDLPKVSHYYTEPYPHYRRKVAVIGGQNSAVEAALQLYRNGAQPTLIHRGSTVGERVKYWIRPDIANRIQEGSIPAYFETTVERIDEKTIRLRQKDGSTVELENDFVLALTGYHTDFGFLKNVGVEVDAETLKPQHDPETKETNIPDVYIAGVATGGKDAGSIFIENARVHAKQILEDIERKNGGAGKEPWE
jgi:putative YpdA family bacillithiol system oxidoreductase